MVLESGKLSGRPTPSGGQLTQTPCRPKSLTELEEAVNDAILSGRTDDKILQLLVDITVTSDQRK